MKFNSKGFTLIEIIVVMVLIAFASSLVFINIGKSGRMKRNRLFAGNMINLCKKARLRAINEGMPACLKISPTLRQCWISFKDTPFKGAADGEEAVSIEDQADENTSILNIPENMRIKGSGIRCDDNNIHYICFYADGSSGGGELTLTSEEDGFAFTFRVDMLTGSIRKIDTEQLEF